MMIMKIKMKGNCERIRQLGCSSPQNKGELSFEGNLALKLNPNTISGQYFKFAQKSNPVKTFGQVVKKSKFIAGPRDQI